jgi:hypothetical protein
MDVPRCAILRQIRTKQHRVVMLTCDDQLSVTAYHVFVVHVPNACAKRCRVVWWCTTACSVPHQATGGLARWIGEAVSTFRLRRRKPLRFRSLVRYAHLCSAAVQASRLIVPEQLLGLFADGYRADFYPCSLCRTLAVTCADESDWTRTNGHQEAKRLEPRAPKRTTCH